MKITEDYLPDVIAPEPIEVHTYYCTMGGEMLQIPKEWFDVLFQYRCGFMYKTMRFIAGDSVRFELTDKFSKETTVMVNGKPRHSITQHIATTENL
jgi:hypothetical protein